MLKKSVFDQFLSVQPGWECEKINKEILLDDGSGAPLAVAYELQIQPEVDALNCVPGVGLIGVLFSLDPNDPRAICCGTLNEPKHIPLYGIHHVLGCQFFPGEFTRIFGISSKELADTEIPLDDFIRVGTVTEEIAAAQTFEQRIGIVRRFIREWEDRTRQSDVTDLTCQIMRNALLQHGNVRLSELADQTGYSTRYLQKLMLDHVGLTPKAALGNMRFQNALRLMLENPYLPLSDLAQQSGYYDQSHFTKVFKEFMGVTPAAFQKQLKDTLKSGGTIRK